MRSIRQRLLMTLLGGMLLIVLAASALIYANAREGANRLFDTQLEQVADAFPSYALAAAYAPRLNDLVASGRLVIQVSKRDPLAAPFSSSLLAPPLQSATGFVTVNSRDGDWRVFTRVGRDLVVQVAQPMSVRSAMAATTALRTALPLLLLVPLLGVLVLVAVDRSLKPLSDIAGELAQRNPAELQPLPASGLPLELQPVVGSLNGLLGRLQETRESEHAFIADAAHAMRTPVAALQVQSQLLERAESDAARDAAQRRLRDGLRRLTRLVDQLLTLGREERKQGERAGGEVDLSALTLECVGEQSVLAEAKSIDLGVEQADPGVVRGDAEDLRVLLRNLLDNAIRYSGPGTRIDVSVLHTPDAAVLRVDDQGPGIPAEERERVFDRFYRGQGATESGNGLGLSIVASIARRHGAAVDLSTPPGGIGLRVEVRFPVEAPQPGAATETSSLTATSA